MRYLPSPSDLGQLGPEAGPGQLESCFADVLGRLQAAEQRAGRALVGPQRDDLEITLDGRDASAYASAGEQRRTAFVLVMAALELGAESGRGASVVLVDDVEAEFDDARLERVFGYLHALPVQALVATSKTGVAERFGPLGRVLRVDRGRIVRD